MYVSPFSLSFITHPCKCLKQIMRFALCHRWQKRGHKLLSVCPSDLAAAVSCPILHVISVDRDLNISGRCSRAARIAHVSDALCGVCGRDANCMPNLAPRHVLWGEKRLWHTSAKCRIMCYLLSRAYSSIIGHFPVTSTALRLVMYGDDQK